MSSAGARSVPQRRKSASDDSRGQGNDSKERGQHLMATGFLIVMLIVAVCCGLAVGMLLAFTVVSRMLVRPLMGLLGQMHGEGQSNQDHGEQGTTPSNDAGNTSLP